MMNQFSEKYLHVLNTKLKGLNLTKILDPVEFYNKQILDSILPYEQDLNFKSFLDQTRLMVDVGFGGGFPILPLAHLLPDYRFVGFETRRKKADAVRLLAGELGLKNVKLYHHRIEDVMLDRQCLVTLKAVGTLENFLPLINTTEKIMVSFYKGPGFIQQESQSLNKLEKAWVIESPVEVEVPGTEKRIMVSCKNKNVPRGTSKTLVNLSEIL
jgi:16S rRNA (guanine527-N7)-methyltransferase